jgi:hypothetical protein
MWDLQFYSDNNKAWRSLADTVDPIGPFKTQQEARTHLLDREIRHPQNAYRVCPIEGTLTSEATDPAHYKLLDPEPIDVVTAWNLHYDIGSALKYLARAGNKPGTDAVTDYRKAIKFIEHRIETLEATRD